MNEWNNLKFGIRYAKSTENKKKTKKRKFVNLCL